MTHRRLWLAIAALGVAAATSDAGGQAPACVVEVDAVPSRPVVGQQVLYRVRILRREDVSRVQWVHPPAFPNLRAEWLPGRAEDTQASRQGSRYLVREEHRALFPAWPGRVTLPAFELRCGDSTLPVPSATLDVREAPTQGRPADFDGVVGPLQVQALAERRQITVGEAVRVSVLVRGASNIWDVQPPFGDLEPNGRYEVFPQPPELDLETGRQLYVRRYFRFDFVPHEEGTIESPAIEIPYYDPTRRRFDRARSEPIVVAVGRRVAPTAARSERSAAVEAEARPDSPAAALPIAAALGAIGLLLGAAGWQLGRRRRGVRARLARALGDARIAEERRDTAARAAALVRALEIVGGNAHPESGGEIAKRRARLESIRFGGAGDSQAGDVWADVEALISRLR